MVIVLADDLGWREIGASGHTFNETPHLDQLAADGMSFSQAYAAAPVCSPTRAALLTGQHPARLGITDYLRPDDPWHLAPGTRTLDRVLRGAGYVTGLIGKWHLAGDYRSRRGGPEHFAWDDVLASERFGVGEGDYFHPYEHLPGLEARAAGEYLTDRLNQEAVEFIRRHRARPFFLLLAHYAPRTRLAGKPALVARFGAKPGADAPGHNPELAAMLASIDEGVGVLRRTLGEIGLADRTLVVFTSDNGGEERVTSNAPLRGGKSHLYEGGVRVPLLMALPGRVPRGRRSRTPVITNDLFVTIAALAGASAPGADGLDLRPLFAGRALPPRPLYWHYPLCRRHFLGGRSASAIRDGRFKLMELLDGGARELYDLTVDPGERHDLAAVLPAEAAALSERLAAWRRRIGADVSSCERDDGRQLSNPGRGAVP